MITMIYIFIIGTLFGSFYLVLGTRLPLKDNIITGRSRCDHCMKTLHWYELIPIISYVIQLGKCRGCKEKISIIHLIMELITGLLFLGGYWYYMYYLNNGNILDYLIYLVLISLVLIIFVSDFKYMIILDSPLIVGSIIILTINYVKGNYELLFNSMLSGILLFTVMYFIKLIGDKVFKKESLGGGDIKLCFVIGASIGFQLGLISLIFASFLALPYAMGTVYFDKKNELPYGPFLISSCTIIFLFIDKFNNMLSMFLLT